MKIIDADTLPDGSHQFVIEAVPATATDPAVTETFTWGSDVPIAEARREMKALLAAKYAKSTPPKLAALIGQTL